MAVLVSFAQTAWQDRDGQHRYSFARHMASLWTLFLKLGRTEHGLMSVSGRFFIAYVDSVVLMTTQGPLCQGLHAPLAQQAFPLIA